MSQEKPNAAHILIVDDEREVRRALACALRQAGYEVSGAATRQEALGFGGRGLDLVIADLRLPDGNGLDVVDGLRSRQADLPAIIITGCGDLDWLSQASRRRPVELLAKPIDLDRLRRTVGAELQRRESRRRLEHRQVRLRELARRMNRQRKASHRLLCQTCADLTAACGALKTQIDRQQAINCFQTDLLDCTSEDDIFRRLFRLFIERTGPLFGVAMLCDENAELQLVGRFGVPQPEGVGFCKALAGALTPMILQRPELASLDAGDNLHLFPPELHRRLVGVTVLVIPLMVGEGQLIGLVVLYRKGEQPFTDDDIALAGMIAAPAAAAVQKT